MATVREVTFDLLRKLELTTIFGNPGSTEETFLQDFPRDFRYVLGLHEASVISMADGYAQATRKPALVNVHTAAGMGNLMGGLATAFQNKTPLIITAGQQTRKMLLLEPWLTNVEATMLPRPWVKWSYEPARAADVPAALMRAYATALQPPHGPVFISIPLDDWDEEAEGEAVVRSVSRSSAPDPARLQEFADRINVSRNPVLITGPALDKTSNPAASWKAAVEVAELLKMPVHGAPGAERATFPQDHPFYMGPLPLAIKPLSDKLNGHDLIIVAGAPVFRYYPYVPGEYIPSGSQLLHLTDDPGEAARAPVGDSLLGCPGSALAQLLPLLKGGRAVAPAPPPKLLTPDSKDGAPLTPKELFTILASLAPPHSIVVQESPSNVRALGEAWKMTEPQSYYTFASGILGFGLPASVGIALAQRDLAGSGEARPVTALIGDGAMQYTVQALWTAAQQSLPVIFVIPNNREYAILKSFAEQEQTRGIPGLDLPGIDILSLARGYGVEAHRASTADEVSDLYRTAQRSTKPTLIEVVVSSDVPPLLG